jgi:hypothetical protein
MGGRESYIISIYAKLAISYVSRVSHDRAINHGAGRELGCSCMLVRQRDQPIAWAVESMHAVPGTQAHQATPGHMAVLFVGRFETREEGQANSALVALLVLLAGSGYQGGGRGLGMFIGSREGQLPTQSGHRSAIAALIAKFR